MHNKCGLVWLRKCDEKMCSANVMSKCAVKMCNIIICVSHVPGSRQPLARRMEMFLRTRMSEHVAIAQISRSWRGWGYRGCVSVLRGRNRIERMCMRWVGNRECECMQGVCGTRACRGTKVALAPLLTAVPVPVAGVASVESTPPAGRPAVARAAGGVGRVVGLLWTWM